MVKQKYTERIYKMFQIIRKLCKLVNKYEAFQNHSKIRLERCPSINILLRGRFGTRVRRRPVRILLIASSRSPRLTEAPVARLCEVAEERSVGELVALLLALRVWEK